MWNKNETKLNPVPAVTPAAAPASPVETRREAATFGSTISIKGELSGEEDVVFQGRLDGKIVLNKHSVTVGKTGRVKADIHAKSIRVAGQVEGNLFGEDEVVIHQTGRVQGNITAPRVSLENGARFKGSIDMELGPGDTASNPTEKGRFMSAGATEDATVRSGSATVDPVPASRLAP